MRRYFKWVCSGNPDDIVAARFPIRSIYRSREAANRSIANWMTRAGDLAVYAADHCAVRCHAYRSLDAAKFASIRDRISQHGRVPLEDGGRV